MGKQLKAIAMLSRSRSPAMPDLATAHEQGLVDFDVVTWNAFFLPKGAPPETITNYSVDLGVTGGGVQPVPLSSSAARGPGWTRGVWGTLEAPPRRPAGGRPNAARWGVSGNRGGVSPGGGVAGVGVSELRPAGGRPNAARWGGIRKSRGGIPGWGVAGLGVSELWLRRSLGGYQEIEGGVSPGGRPNAA